MPPSPPDCQPSPPGFPFGKIVQQASDGRVVGPVYRNAAITCKPTCWKMPMATPSAPTQLLRATKCFANLDEEALCVLGAYMTRVSYAVGDHLCEDDGPGDWMLVIEQGEISVMKHDGDGEHIEMAVLSKGDVAGEMSLFSKSPRTADLVAKTAVAIWTLTYEDLDTVMGQHPSIARGLLATLSAHLSRGTSLLAKLMARDIDRRFKVAIFDSKRYMETALLKANVNNYSLRFFKDRLTPRTAALAAGCQAVCVFVNDDEIGRAHV